MEQKTRNLDLKSLYLREFLYWNGYNFEILNIVDINFEKKTLTIAITNQGKISVREFEVLEDKLGNPYIKYGVVNDTININEFEQVSD